jgi:transposase
MDVNALPTDPNELIAMILDREATITQLKQEAAEQLEAQRARLAADHQARIAKLEAEHKAHIQAILRKFYGPRSESFDPKQLLLFGQLMVDTLVDPKVVEAEAGEKLTTRKIVNRHKHGRGALPADLPRVEVMHDLTDEQKKCPCCNAERTCIGSEDSEQLEMNPPTFHVIRHKRMKYACKTCDQSGLPANIEVAPKPTQPIEKGLAAPGLLAYIILSKLGDHLPLYRLEGIFARVNIHIARSTMCAWMMSCGTLVQPLVDLIALRITRSKVIHTDDTTVKVQDANLKGRCRTGRVWCYLGDEDNPYDLFDFTPDRKHEHPQKFLDKFEGYLQADAYGGYDGIFTEGTVHEVACWAHARRKFFDAKETDARVAGTMLRLIQLLYRVESAIKTKIDRLLKQNANLSRDEQNAIAQSMRRHRSKIILARIKKFLDECQTDDRVLPRSKSAEAITYAQNQWTALTRYTEQGFLNIDNNAAERALKRVAIGRKNWLFAGTDEAGKSHANLWTLIASAQRHGLDPHAYLRSVLSKIAQTKLSELDQFLPENWKADEHAHASSQPNTDTSAVVSSTTTI